MSRLALLAIACELDRDWLARKGLTRKDETTDTEEFSVSPILPPTDRSQLGVRHLTTFYCDTFNSEEDLREAIDFALGAGDPIVLFFLGTADHCTRCDGVRSVLRRRARGRLPLLVCLRCVPQPTTPRDLPEMASDTRFIPHGGKDSLEGIRPIEKRRAYCQRHLRNSLREYAESRQRHVEVGIGALLIDPRGRFLLTRRRWNPGANTIGTFGGVLPKRRRIVEALFDQATNEFGLSRRHLSFGPLLSCTHVRAGVEDFVDLTLLGLLRREETPKLHPDSRHGYVDPSSQKLWYSYDELRRMFKRGELFLPVAAAFRQFTELVVLGDRTHALALSAAGLVRNTSAIGALPTRLRSEFPDPHAISGYLSELRKELPNLNRAVLPGLLQ